MLSKEEMRRKTWALIRASGVARFPGAQGRIPNFVGAEKAAQRVLGLDVWQQARYLKCNPDLPQRPLRQRALEQGKVVYMAVPRLRDLHCFVELDPARLTASPYACSSIKGAFMYGRTIILEELHPIDLVVCGAVAVTREGARLGKGGGFSDLEYGLAREVGKIEADTPIITTVHALQLTDEEIPSMAHDISLDYVVTPQETIQCPSVQARPTGIHWDLLTEEQMDSIPILREMRFRAASGRA